MAEELVELTAAIQHELELARSGDGYEEAAVAGEIVERIVAPLLAARGASFDQRLSDFREEYRKSLESWDRSRKRLDGTVEELRAGWREADQQHARDVELLLWLHAEAVALNEWYLKTGRIQQRWVDEDRAEVERLTAELARVEASRQAWAEEALRVDPPAATPDDIADIVAEFGNLNTFLTEQVTEKLFEFYVFYPKPRRRSEPLTNYVCACSIDAEQVVAAGWVRPQCAVHPEGQGDSPRWTRPVPECSTQNHAHYAHEVLLPDLSTVTCPGQGMSPSSSVHPEAGGE